jgi:hypothetical protein
MKGTVVMTIVGSGLGARRGRGASWLWSARCQQWRTTSWGRITVSVRSGGLAMEGFDVMDHGGDDGALGGDHDFERE